MTLRRTNFHLWSGVYRRGKNWRDDAPDYPTVVIDVELASWALPLAVHAGGPLLGKPGFHFRILCVNIGWSRL